MCHVEIFSDKYPYSPASNSISLWVDEIDVWEPIGSIGSPSAIQLLLKDLKDEVVKPSAETASSGLIQDLNMVSEGESNQTLLKSLWTTVDGNFDSIEETNNHIMETIKHIKHKICEDTRPKGCGLEMCRLTEEACEGLASVIRSNQTKLEDLNVSDNNLRDSGAELIFNGLMAPHCKLQTLRIGDCHLTEDCCEDLALALCSPLSELNCLDLWSNSLKDSGINQLSTGLSHPRCKLQKLGLSGCDVTDYGCASLLSTLRLNHAYLRELDLGHEHADSPGLKHFSELLEDSSCNLEKILVSQDGETRRAPLLKYACPLTFDINTTSGMVSLSEDIQTVTDTALKIHPKERHPQVLCREDVSGHSYWEAEWKDQACYIGLTHKGIGEG
ncbi:uncharacterized protein ACWYII_043713 [Salvelinus alpinus]